MREDLELYLDHAKQHGYAIMNNFDIVIMPIDVYHKFLSIDGGQEILKEYQNKNNINK